MGTGSGKGLSFGATLGSLANAFYANDEPTATVWPHIEWTQPNYAGTEIPRSFIVSTPNGSFWTHANATKHMKDYVMKFNNDPRIRQTNPKLLSQFLLYDYRKTLIRATTQSKKYGELIREGHWEFKLSKRKPDELPVVVHAVFLGFR